MTATDVLRKGVVLGITVVISTYLLYFMLVMKSRVSLQELLLINSLSMIIATCAIFLLLWLTKRSAVEDTFGGMS